jgi:hypothetical protein
MEYGIKGVMISLYASNSPTQVYLASSNVYSEVANSIMKKTPLNRARKLGISFNNTTNGFK